MGRLTGAALAAPTILCMAGCGAPAEPAPPLTEQDQAFPTRAGRAYGQPFDDSARAVEQGRSRDMVTSSGPVSPREMLPEAADQLEALGAESPGAIAGAGYAVYCADYESQINWIKTRTTDG